MLAAKGGVFDKGKAQRFAAGGGAFVSVTLGPQFTGTDSVGLLSSGAPCYLAA